MMAKRRRLTGPLLFGWAVGEADLSAFSAAEAGVLRAMGDFLNFKTWQCFPSIGTLARHANTTAATVRRALSKAESAGIVHRPEVRQRMAAGSKRQKVVLRVDIEVLCALGFDRAEADRAERGAVSDGEGGGIEGIANPSQTERETNQSQETNPDRQHRRTTGGSAAAEGLDRIDPETARQWLVIYGVRGHNLNRLASLQITLRQIREAGEAIRNNPAIKSKTGALVRRLDLIAAGGSDWKVKSRGIGRDPEADRLQQLRKNRGTDRDAGVW